MESFRIWKLLPADPAAGSLAQACGIAPLIAQILLNRGVRRAEDARAFLRPTLSTLSDPFRLPQMAEAVAAIRQAVRAGRLVLVFGDSDVDGISAATLVSEAITRLGGRVAVRLSNRLADGYGFPPSRIARVARSGIGLVILVDCGTNQADEIEALSRQGIPTVVLDHHVPSGRAARPAALVNPHVGDGAGFGLCSTGLAVKLIQAISPGDRDALERSLDVAALGTLADYSPLAGDNRVLVTEGLARLLESRRPGLRHLCDAVGISSAQPDQVLKRLVPRLNACGRLGGARPVWRALTATSEADATRASVLLEEAHATTKSLHRQVMTDAYSQVSRLHFRDHQVLVVGRRGWPAGLMGPLASALVQQYARPVVALALDERVGVGSGRAPEPFNLFEALRSCERMLLRYGGHARACGLTLASGDFEAFRAQINQYAQAAPLPDHGRRTLLIDADARVSDLSHALVEQMDALKPFGIGNPKPTVLLRGVTIRAGEGGGAWIEDGGYRLRIRGKLPPGESTGAYDVVVAPTLINAEPAATVCDLRARPGDESSRRAGESLPAVSA